MMFAKAAFLYKARFGPPVTSFSDKVWGEGFLQTNLDLSPSEPGLWMFEGIYQQEGDDDDLEDRFIGSWRCLTDAEASALVFNESPWDLKLWSKEPPQTFELSADRLTMRWIVRALESSGTRVVRRSFGPNPEIDCVLECGCLVNIRSVTGAELFRRIERHVCGGKEDATETV